MWRTRSCFATAAVAALLAGSACDPTTAAVPILIITNTWGVEGDPERKFSFNSEDDGQTSGTFEGFEQLDTPDEFIQNPLQGTWSDGTIEFTVEGTRNGAQFEGTFADAPDRITIYSEDLNETLVIVRGL